MRYVRSMMVVVAACGPGLPPGEGPGSTSTTGEGSPTTGLVGGTGLAGTSGAAGTTGEMSTSGAASSSAGSSSSGEAPFLVELDGGIAEPCNPFTQDCPEGSKCTPYADDGGTSWNSTICSPVMEDPAQKDEPCFVVGNGVSGIDNCDIGLMCWGTDAENIGFCIELCTGSPEAGYCSDPNDTCAVYSDGHLALCLHGCNPLAQNCVPSDVCIGIPNGEGFLCVLDASGREGQRHDPCEFANACDPGLICNEPSAAVECDQEAMGCCEPFCDLTDPNADENCSGLGQVCNPYFEEGTAPPNYEDVGYCAVPM